MIPDLFKLDPKIYEIVMAIIKLSSARTRAMLMIYWAELELKIAPFMRLSKIIVFVFSLL